MMRSIAVMAIALADSRMQASAAGPIEGQAVITLPQGATMSPGRAARPNAQPLAPAPIAGLFQPGPGGPLPVIGKDGRTPFQAYARPFTSNGKPHNSSSAASGAAVTSSSKKNGLPDVRRVSSLATRYDTGAS